MPTVNKTRGWLSTVSYVIKNPQTGVITSSGTTVNPLSVVDTLSKGGSVPDWRQKIAQGSSATSPLSGTRHSFSPGNGYYWAIKNNGQYEGYSSGTYPRSFSMSGSASTSTDPAADNQARSYLLGSYIKAQNNWRGGNFIAELAETVGTLRRPSHALFRATDGFAKTVRSLGRLSAVSPKAYARALAAAWLGYSFEAKPLMEDANDAAEALAELTHSTRHDTCPIRGSGKSEVVTSQTTVDAGVQVEHPGWVIDRTVIQHSKVKYYGAIRTSPPSVDNTLKTFGIGIFDVIPAVWEAIPWSFFIDYFVNVNELLDGLRYVNANLAWLNYGVRNDVTVTFGSIYGPNADATFKSRIGGSSPTKLSSVYVSRGASGLPYPNFTFKLPGGVGKTLNISALSQLILSSRPPARK